MLSNKIPVAVDYAVAPAWRTLPLLSFQFASTMWTELCPGKDRLPIKSPTARITEARRANIEERYEDNRRDHEAENLRLLTPCHVIHEPAEYESSQDDENWEYPPFESCVAVEVEEQKTTQTEDAPKHHERDDLRRRPACVPTHRSVGNQSLQSGCVHRVRVAMPNFPII